MLFINPAAEQFGGFLSRYVPVGIPISIGCLIGYMEKHGIPCRIIDEELGHTTAERARELLRDMPKPWIVGIGCLTAHAARAYEVASMLKREFPGITTIIGGLHPTAVPDEPLETGVIDYVVRGEGEEVLLNLYRAIHEGGDPTALKGVSYRRDGRIVHNADAPLIPDLDTIPPFPYHVFDHPRYDMGFLITSRGCPYRCAFCSQRMMTGSTYRYKSIDNVVDELEHLVDHFGQKAVVFYDDNFCVKSARVIELCDAIVARGLHKKVVLSVQTRADNILRAGDEVLSRMVAAGFNQAGIGLETGVQRLADLTMKDETIEQHIEAIRLCQRHGMGVALGMIFGLPTETTEDRRASFELIRGLGISGTKFNNLIPYPGTPLYRDLKDSGRMIKSPQWSNFNSTLAITRSVFDKTPLPYVPDTSSEWEMKREIVLYNLRSYLTFKVILGILDHSRGMGWISLPKRWYLNPAELWQVVKVGLHVMTNFAWVSLPLWLTEPIMKKLDPGLCRRDRVAGYDPAKHVASDWDKETTRQKAVLLKSARDEYEAKGRFSLAVDPAAPPRAADSSPQ
jgi:radical SAM superfamily enzyme YgiQ (UPF0313 family)